MRKTVAIVFAGGRAEELSVLTFWRPKSAVVFGGTYRMIDFALTNLANTKSIENVGVLTQYRPSSLVDHIGIGLPWDFVGTKRGCRILAPYTGLEHTQWYRGTADALYQNIDFLNLHRPDDVLIISGDHAYNIDYEPLLRFHMEHAADVTLAFTPVEKDPSRFGIAELNSEGQIVSYTEKPEHPRSNLASMTVYVFRREVLLEELRRHAASDQKSFHIYDEILPLMIERRRAYGWVHHGTWDYARTLDAYFEAHQDMLGVAPRLDLAAWQIRTNLTARCAAAPGPTRHGPKAQVQDSIISPGCRIEGQVVSSVLSPGVQVKPGAKVLNSVLWHDVVVESGAVLDGVICDKRCVIGANAEIGFGPVTVANSEQPKSLTKGVSVLGMDVHVPKAAKIGRNCIIYPHAGSEQLTKPISSGQTVPMPIND